jgi:hypothetical protein
MLVYMAMAWGGLNHENLYFIGHRCKISDAVEELVWNVVEENEIAATITRIIKDIDIVKFRSCLTPAVIVGNEIKVMGRKPRKEEVLSWIMAERLMPDESGDTECFTKWSSCVNNN